MKTMRCGYAIYRRNTSAIRRTMRKKGRDAAAALPDVRRIAIPSKAAGE